MSGVSIQMNGQSFDSIGDMADALKKGISAELISENYRRIGLVNVCVMAFEKFFFRNGSYTSLTVVLTEDGESKTADIIGAGGGEGLFNISWGANEEIAMDAVKVLSRFGLVRQ